MQNVSDVASLSPPSVTNATKPAANAVRVSNGESFDLLLSRAADNIQKTIDQQDDPKSRPDSRSDESTAILEKTGTQNEFTNKKEIKKTKTENRKESVNEKECSEVSDNSVAVVSNGQVSQEQPTNGLNETTSEIPLSGVNENGEQVIDLGLEETSMLSNQSANSVGMKDSQYQKISTELDPGQKNTENLPLTPDGLKNGQVGTNAEILGSQGIQQPVNSASVQAQNQGAAIEIEDHGLSQGVEKTSENVIKSIEFKDNQGADGGKDLLNKQNLENPEQLTGMDEKDSQVEQKTSSSSDAAPPGATVKQESVIGHNTNITQSYEPARLAEAPKAETISRISSQIENMVKTNQSSIRVQLYPEELGHIDLRIVSNKNGVGVSMVVDKASTQDVLKSEMNLLKQTIEQAGIQLSDLNIGQGKHSGQQQMAEEQEGHNKYSFNAREDRSHGISEKTEKVILHSSVVDYKV